MKNPIPRSILPDTWKAKTRCPICSAGALQVLHLPAAPDQMACRICQSAFEVEEHGQYLRFTKLAQPLAEILANRWVTMAAVRGAIHNARRAVENRQPARSATEAPFSQPPSAPDFDGFPFKTFGGKTINGFSSKNFREKTIDGFSSKNFREKTIEEQPLEPPFPGGPLTDDEVLAKAQALHKLGNSLDRIATILARNPLTTPEQIQGARSALATQDELTARRQNRIFYLSGGAAVFMIILCLVVGFLAQSLNNSDNIGKLSQAQPTDIIRAIIPEIIQEPSKGAVAAICPMTRSDAARLFGGEARDWNGKNDNWSFITTPQATVYVPKGMSALLLLDVNLNTVNLDGPATIKNVFAITIYCP